MSDEAGYANVGKGPTKGKGKGSPLAVAPKPKPKAAGPSKASAPAFKVKTVDRSQFSGARPTKLRMMAAQQVVVAQEANGHFDAAQLAMKLYRTWEKLLVSEFPSGVRVDLSGDVVDATVFVVRLFERFIERSGSADDDERYRVISWFGSGTVAGNRWLDDAFSWLQAQQPGWRETRVQHVDVIVDKLFATDEECMLPAGFVDNKELQAKQQELNEKFASAQMESLRRAEVWTANHPLSELGAISWDKVTAIRWLMGGGGGCYMVRVEDQKFIVKGCIDEGDVLAHEFSKFVGVQVVNTRFISPSSSEFQTASLGLEAAEADEPEMHNYLQKMLAMLRTKGCPLMVMEFLDGATLRGRSASERFVACDEGLIRTLGGFLAMDSVLNNWDRLPALRTWPHKGNLDNVLITTSGEVVAIDQALQLLCEPQVRVKYFSALRAFADEVMQADSLDGEGLRRIKDAIRNQVMKWTGDAEKDAELQQHFVNKQDKDGNPDFGVPLADVASGHLLDGVRDIFSKIAVVRAEFVANKTAFVDNAKEFFTEVEGARQFERIEAGASFIEESLKVLESEESYKNVLQETLDQSIVHPGRVYTHSR